MREPKNQMLGTMEPPLMQLSVKIQNHVKQSYANFTFLQIVRQIHNVDNSEPFPGNRGGTSIMEGTLYAHSNMHIFHF